MRPHLPLADAAIAATVAEPECTRKRRNEQSLQPRRPQCPGHRRRAGRRPRGRAHRRLHGRPRRRGRSEQRGHQQPRGGPGRGQGDGLSRLGHRPGPCGRHRRGDGRRMGLHHRARQQCRHRARRHDPQDEPRILGRGHQCEPDGRLSGPAVGRQADDQAIRDRRVRRLPRPDRQCVLHCGHGGHHRPDQLRRRQGRRARHHHERGARMGALRHLREFGGVRHGRHADDGGDPGAEIRRPDHGPHPPRPLCRDRRCGARRLLPTDARGELHHRQEPDHRRRHDRDVRRWHGPVPDRTLAELPVRARKSRPHGGEGVPSGRRRGDPGP